jgi:UDP-N-acetylmuramate dehydrogenase
MVNIEEIKKLFRGRIALNEPLNRYTSFRIGGPADYYLEPADKEDLVSLVPYLQRVKCPYVILGRGSNLLVSDDGLRSAVINLEYGLNSVRVENNCVIAEAGVAISRLVDFCIQHSLRGMEMLPGIPGTVGGAVVMNAGAYDGEVSDHLVDVEVLRNGAIMEVKKEDAEFSYRHSNFQHDVVLSARFAFPHGEKEEIARRRKELLVRRNQSQPLNYPNSGSMFKNPPGNFAARLIEEAGLKGTQQGQAKISEKHANFIVNLGGATANDVVKLIVLTKTTVREKYNVILEPEVKLVGFSENTYKEVYS